MRRRSFVFSLAMLVTLALQMPAANACMGSNILLEDDFKTMAPNWSKDDASWAGNSMFLMTPQLHYEKLALNDKYLPADMDACVDLVLTAGDLTSGELVWHNAGGLAFWVADPSREYSSLNYKFLVSPEGTFAIFRSEVTRQPPQFNRIAVIDWTKSPAIKPGLNQVNTLRVMTKGNQATFYVNGTRLTAITGQPPPHGDKIGLVGASGATQSNWHFSNFKVTD